ALVSTHPVHPAVYALSLHDALPISRARVPAAAAWSPPGGSPADRRARTAAAAGSARAAARACACRQLLRRSAGGWSVCSYELLRSEEHTSELQSQSNLVCRLLLEKK